MRPRTSKRASQELRYSRARREFLADHPWCQGRAGCGRHATEVHHKRGRRGTLLLDQDHWLAVCHACHRWITEHPRLAEQQGLSETRHVQIHAFLPDAGGVYCATCMTLPMNWRHRSEVAAP